jgi:(2Fe-2S) ferredoxin
MSAQPARRCRVVLCRGQYCNLSRRADRLLVPLEARVAALNDTLGERRVRVETANCLSMCGAGPNLIVYPQGRVFNGLSEDDLDAVLACCLENMVQDGGGASS